MRPAISRTHGRRKGLVLAHGDALDNLMLVDGAAAVLIGNERGGEILGTKPRARIRAYASIGSEPTIMLTGPAYAAEKVLKRAGLKSRN